MRIRHLFNMKSKKSLNQRKCKNKDKTQKRKDDKICVKCVFGSHQHNKNIKTKRFFRSSNALLSLKSVCDPCRCKSSKERHEKEEINTLVCNSNRANANLNKIHTHKDVASAFGPKVSSASQNDWIKSNENLENESWSRNETEKQSKLLLNYVLKKKRKEINSSSTSDNCICCSNCMNKLLAYITEEISKQQTKKAIKQRWVDSEFSLNRHQCHSKSKNRLVPIRKHKSDTSVPQASAGIVGSQNFKIIHLSDQNNIVCLSAKPRKRKCRFVVAFVLVDKIASKKKPQSKAKSRKITKPKKKNTVSPSTRCVKVQQKKQAHIKKRLRNHKRMGHGKIRGRKKLTRSKWKLLSVAAIRKLKKQLQERLVTNDVKGNEVSKDRLQVPMPRAGRRGPAKKTCLQSVNSLKKNPSSSNERNWPSAINKHTLNKQYQNIASRFFPAAPAPNGRVPTYIAMVKTAIRDLKQFALTGKDAISKYIHIRYNLQNDHLLTYVLKWMCDMGVLRCKEGQYSYSGKKLIKKDTATVLRKCKRNEIKSLLYRDTKPVERSCGWRAPGKCCKKQCSKHRKGVSGRNYLLRKSKCPCSKKLCTLKNRIKLRTRYVRSNGKIYREEEFI